MQQVEDQFYLTPDEAAQLLDRPIPPEAAGARAEEIAAANKQPLTRNAAPSEQFLRVVHDAMSCGIMVLSAINQVVEVNRAARQILGMNLDELQHILATGVPTLFTRLDGSTLPLEEQSYHIAFRTGNPQRNILEGFIRPDGQQRWLQVDAVPVHNVDEAIMHVVVSFTDVTEHIEAGRLARAREIRLQTVISNVPATVYAIDRTGIITFLEGKGVKNSTGAAGVIPEFDLYRDVPEALHNVRRALAGEAFITQDEVGEQVFESRFMPVLDQNGDITSIICITMDVTERTRAEQTAQAKGQQAQEALYESQARFRSIMQLSLDAIIAANGQGKITSWNVGAQDIFGYTENEVLGQSLTLLMPERFREAHQRGLERVTATGQPHLLGHTMEIVGLRKNGSEFPIELSFASWKTADSRYYSAIIRDISERVRAEKTLRASEQRFRALTEQATDLVLILDAGGRFQYVSPSHQRIMGRSSEELINTNVFTFIHPADLARTRTEFAAAFKERGSVVRTEYRLRHANGSWVTLECIGRNCFDDPAIKGFIVNARDISERMAMEERLRYHTLHDPLTNLPNRILLQERLEQALLIAPHTGRSMALLMLDLDRFKEINDTFGYRHGDFLLQQVGIRLRKAMDISDSVARLGSDEFAILLPTADEARARQAASELCAVLDEPCMVAGFPLQVEASIGIALYPTHGTDTLTLMRHADIAMYSAKRTHQGHVLYNAKYDDLDSSRRFALIGALRHAITANELILYYQPKADLKTGTLSSVEALARWQHPTYGFVPPDQFIPLAEQTGLITPLTHWVLETAIRQCGDWLRAGLDLCVAVNLSMWNLREATLPDIIAGLLEHYNVPARLLRVELTESAIMTDTELALDVLKRLAALGIRMSIDDFGTGYSSLTYLKRLPVDELKIDRSFVQHMATIETDETIVRSTVTMAHGLGLQVVAEGVEDLATWHLLAAINCDIAQGYYMSRPLPAPDLESWLRSTQQTVAH